MKKPKMRPSATFRLAQLDEPFHGQADPRAIEVPNVLLVPSPLGDEIVEPQDCDEPTRIMTLEQSQALLDACNPHRHETCQMPAVRR